MPTAPPPRLFTPGGYLYKKVVAKPDWLAAAGVVDIFSMSTCSSEAFSDDFFEAWKHNDLWLFDEPETMTPIAQAAGVDLCACRLFYYEMYEPRFDETTREWSSSDPAPSSRDDVRVPGRRRLEGYDVVSFADGSTPGCSPLSCNSLAATLPVNAHCLFASFDEAKSALDDDRFGHAEPGPYRIVAVYTVE